MIIVRELTGGLYYGTRARITGDTAGTRMVYNARRDRAHRAEGFELARNRRPRSPAWISRTCSRIRGSGGVVTEVRRSIRTSRLDHLLVDNCAMQLILNPRRFDIILTENMFGDILSDRRAVLAGSIGMLPSPR